MPSLTTIFGIKDDGRPAEDAAKASTRKFVRSDAELAVYEPERRPTGHVLTAWEAYSAFGIEVLEEAVEYGAAILKCERNATASALKRRREKLNLSQEDVARAASLTSADIESAESIPSRLPTTQLENAAFVLGLDERLLAFKRDSGGDDRLAYRLRALSSNGIQSPRVISPRTALLFAEAASIIRVQLRLQRWLEIETESGSFTPSDFYGSFETPAWRAGYNLAEEARKTLGLGQSPIRSMRELVEERLGIPVVQVHLGQKIAGATVLTVDEEDREARGVILNTAGDNENVWMRRATIAHELGHLLFDPYDKLENVRVDPYNQSQADPEAQDIDHVEQRANAFAIAFLAPLDQVRRLAPFPFSRESIVNVMQTFGISRTAARYHISNAHYRQNEVPHFELNEPPSDELKGAESFTGDFFPLKNTSLQRCGRFAGLVARAVDEGYISEHTASLYLQCSVPEFRERSGSLREIFG